MFQKPLEKASLYWDFDWKQFITRQLLSMEKSTIMVVESVARELTSSIGPVLHN